MCLSAFPLQHLMGWEGNHLVTPQQGPEGWWEFLGKEMQLVPHAGKRGRNQGTGEKYKQTSRSLCTTLKFMHVRSLQSVENEY